MSISFISLNMVNNKLAYQIAASVYEITNNTRQEMVQASNILSTLEGNILLITDYSSGDGTRLFDTYTDDGCLYRTNLASLISEGFLEDEVVDLNYECTSDIVVRNSGLDQVQWVIAPKNIALKKGSFLKAEDFPLTDYRIYQNKDIEKVSIESMFPITLKQNHISAEDRIFFSDIENGQYLSQEPNQKIVSNPATFITKGLYKIVINYQYLDENNENQGKAIGKLELGNNVSGNLVQKELVSGSTQVTIDQLNIQDNLWQGEFRIFAYVKGVKFENCMIERIE